MEDDWFDYKLEHDPRFLQRIAQARASVRAGKGVRLEDIRRIAHLNAKDVRGEPTDEAVTSSTCSNG
jgi:hypothetical protein